MIKKYYFSFFFFAVFVLIAGCATQPYISSNFSASKNKRIGVYIQYSHISWGYPVDNKDCGKNLEIEQEIKNHLAENGWEYVILNDTDKRKSLSQLISEARAHGLAYFMLNRISSGCQGQPDFVPEVDARAVSKIIVYDTNTKEVVFSATAVSRNIETMGGSTSYATGYHSGSSQTTRSISYSVRDVSCNYICKEAIAKSFKSFPKNE